MTPDGRDCRAAASAKCGGAVSRSHLRLSPKSSLFMGGPVAGKPGRGCSFWGHHRIKGPPAEQCFDHPILGR